MLQVPSISLAAIPDTRMRGPSSHQIGPSPSQTHVGVNSKLSTEGTIITEATKAKISGINWATLNYSG